jgi:dihydropyrimidinase
MKEGIMRRVIKGGTIVTADRSYEADIAVENGVIAEIGPDLKGDEVLDASGCYVMPGGIDPHVHLQMPFMGTFSADDFESGTRAALAGGTTMVVDFCLPDPQQAPLDALAIWDAKARGACADYSYHMAVTWWGETMFDQMQAVTRRGINTFKHFLAYKGALMVNDEELFASFRRCAELGSTALVHAENGDVVAAMQEKLLSEGLTGPEGHALSRPPEVEGEATNRAIMLADMAGVPLYVVHTSCEQAHEAIRRARQKGMRVYGEPLIQHLVLDDSEYRHENWDHAAQRVMSPPFRDKRHQDSLWAGLQAGSLQVVATDHCAFTIEQKRFGLNDFTRIPNGTGGLEDRMPVLWTEGVNTGRLTPNEFVAVTSTNIAKILNCYPQKGAILPGSDADIVVWDPEKSATITPERQQSVVEYNVFEGREVKGLPRYTLARGEVAVEDGAIRATPGHGRFVGRPPMGPVNKALSTWKAATAPRGVARSAADMPGGV